jgi:hypothetical protein
MKTPDIFDLSKELGKVIKKTVREIETGEGVLIFLLICEPPKVQKIRKK